MNDKTKHKHVVAAPYPVSPAAKPVRSDAKAGRPSRRAGAAAFLRGFAAHPFEVASVVPSSAFLEARVVQAAYLAASATPDARRPVA